ncbi:MAG: prepilin-type N-terminal cleavage/methylation domain-containing protein [Clostridiales Family XIII bacterium]|jgi:prepilin-type N-terminal cleavage/methylation domain-containing protein|nr:prepilin-type N-terminal cleavage/methylation domain-containing protein [Clostridiales Family XIII bacterium]
MNMILKTRLANRRGRAGFTLVEVIVVLVILAILAAIAIPALTGYIDKAEWTRVKSEVKAQMTAYQTMIIEQMTRDGEIKTYSQGNAGPRDYFKLVADHESLGLYSPTGLTTFGVQELRRLTGEDYDLANAEIMAQTDLSGAIKNYRYYDYNYFSEVPTVLEIIYIPDVNATDEITKAFVKWHKDNIPQITLTSGYNLIRYNRSVSGYTTCVKIN